MRLFARPAGLRRRRDPLTATLIGSGTDTNNDDTVALTTSVAVEAGQSIVVVMLSGGETISSISDGTANSYTQVDGVTGADIWHCLNPVAVSSSSTITATLTGSDNKKALVAYVLSGTAALQSSAAAAVGPASITTDGSVLAGSIAIGGCALTTNSTFTQPTDWTEGFDQNVDSDGRTVAHRTVAETGTVTYAPTLDTPSGLGKKMAIGAWK